MLQREGFVVADMSAPTPLQRSSWKAEAIRRGNLKISGPMPITEDTPLNEEEEKEFAEKGGLESSRQTQDVPEEQVHRPETPPQPSQPPPSIPVQASALRSNPVQAQSQSPQPEESLASPQTRSPPGMLQVVENVQRQSEAQSIPLISPSPYRATPDGTTISTQNTQKKKRKSGLRGVFRKMFGRKSRDENEIGEEDVVHRGHNYHHSDPGLLQRQSPPREQKTPNGQRISDLPVKDLQPLRPLGQHLPFPMNVNAPQASPPHDYLTFDSQKLHFGRRRASLPTVPCASTHRHSFDESHGRLPTWEERLEDDDMTSPGIGIALSSPVQPTPLPQKRRSRSADALRDIVRDHASFEGGRNAEIKRWRESFASGSVYSRPQTAKTVETVQSVQMQEPEFHPVASIQQPDFQRMVQTQEPTTVQRMVQTQEPTIQEQNPEAAVEMSATLSHADDPETPVDERRELVSEREVQAPVSAFNFGNLQHEQHIITESLPEVPPEAPTPPLRSQNRVPIEDRIQHLESAYENLEGSIRRISTRNNRQTIILENAPKNLRTRDRSASTRSISASRSHSRSQPSIHQEPIHQPSIDTLNPGPPSPTLVLPPSTLPLPDQAGKDVLHTVYEALRHERAARKALEAQIRTLQHDVSDLHALVNKLIVSATATSPNYPTPSPDTLVIYSTEDRLSTPRAERKLDYAQQQQQRQDEERQRQRTPSVYSTSENASVSTYDGNSSTRGYDDVATPDVWATPKEERFAGSGYFTGDGRVRGYA
ncbi:hypothetical protein IAQ61_007569 [Plenodomus lingam]|uniref:uncharacterized protein n=1 Tax=Leptosphaeria maculans TaxID=5022 RepID=UPI0033330145|nr:hypothetical protein IAQ61_007569 [Plenodomus lingam]